MLLVAFLWTFAMVTLVLSVYAVIRYAAPDSFLGKISLALV